MENKIQSDPTSSYEIRPLGDRAIVIGLKQEDGVPLWKRAAGLSLLIRSQGAQWIMDVVPAYDTVTVVYDPVLLGFGHRGEAAPPYEAAAAFIEPLLRLPAAADGTGARTVDIPVCYGGEYGPDLAECAMRSDILEEAFVALHAGGKYEVAMIGFMPGFPYLTGLPEDLAQPRRPSPRSRVPAGSVGIAGGGTGIYPLASPGGWQLIGRTPIRLFDPDRAEPFLLRAGDTLRFLPITAKDMLQQLRGEG
ncbi:5-oxoprolinase subunit PxpB [Paenibacillus sacheonensis]|uniref:5-oxoprolinase subunit PxpB n=1 Tax=Paenibacillus sacheonensis TaxID=742054 RepID=A0A7X5C2M6_9BACL|nr:5-oxoprolinase subunit PxpB [Paenibacillus sacheonensis]MBM7566808.1 inhibitor of KinA [Paenibacillus sacheonensis]NBC71430.1 5-oxoprolinase subunit PxpB [Paenibacillus sacheonensis]